MGFFDIFRIDEIKAENARLKAKLAELGYDDVTKARQELASSQKAIADNNNLIASLTERRTKLETETAAAEKRNETTLRKLARSKELYKSMEYALTAFAGNFGDRTTALALVEELDMLVPSVTLHLNCMDVKSLSKAFRENEKQISKLLELYSSRYTTKANRAIYQLMVIALRAELQNILYNLKYEKLDAAIEQVKSVTTKYLAIAGEGNQSINSTLTKFIGEIEYLFINAVKIEYNYYVKKEQAKQEQAAIREQMRQEAAERKALEAEKKKVEAEEKKFQKKIEELQEQLTSAAAEQAADLEARIRELEAQLSNVAVEKERIVNLQNGKAGNIYVISNLGSFGDKMFKIGMTRRMDPQDRVNELGDASVPFKFDVHCFIFSEDAVSLETALHTRLNDKRVNKVNLRKEFFYATVDELEELVHEIDPTAAFTKTMAATEFRQSISSEGNYTSEYTDTTAEDDE